MEKVRALNAIAERRGQSLAQMAIAWTLRDQRVTSALIGASSVEQLEDSLAALDRLDFSEDELAEIDFGSTAASTSGPSRAGSSGQQRHDFFREASNAILEARRLMVEIDDEAVAAGVEVLGQALGDPLCRPGDGVATTFVRAVLRLVW